MGALCTVTVQDLRGASSGVECTSDFDAEPSHEFPSDAATREANAAVAIELAPKEPRYVQVCNGPSCSSQGASILISDLEDLAILCDIVVKKRGCMGRCGRGPNAKRPTSAPQCFVHGGLDSFSRTMDFLAKEFKGTLPTIPQSALEQIRGKSDASHLVDASKNVESSLASLQEAEKLLTAAIDMGCISNAPGLIPKCYFLRGSVRAKLARDAGALDDFDAVISAGAPQTSEALLGKAKIYQGSSQLSECIECIMKALKLGVSDNGERVILERRVADLKAVQRGELSMNVLTNASVSTDGSGRWKLVRIDGKSWDTCVYEFEFHPPSEKHPYRDHACTWHVSVRFGEHVRDYTPISTVEDWERGNLKLLVKSYESGNVSKHFAQLRPARPRRAHLGWNTPLEDQNCWVIISAPRVTLYLPSLQESPDIPSGPISHVFLVVGGTGVAPALQLLREISDSSGIFGKSCRGTLLYSSRTSADALLVDELRNCAVDAEGRVLVWHTFTAQKADDDSDFDLDFKMLSIEDAHMAFSSFPPPLKRGPLKMGDGEEAGLRGRIDSKMIQRVLPSPGPGTYAVICGPPGMWQDLSLLLQHHGYPKECLIELRSGANEAALDNQGL